MVGTQRALINVTRFTRLALTVCLAGALGACAGSHLHSSKDHELAKQALTAFDDADLPASIEDEYGLLSEMLDRELAIVRRHTLAERDAVLIAIIGATDEDPSRIKSWDYFDTKLNERERELVGGDAQATAPLRNALALLPLHERNLAGHAHDYDAIKRAGDPALTCPLPTGLDPAKVSADARPSLEQYRDTCNQYLLATKTLRDFATAGSALAKVNLQLIEIDGYERAVKARAAVIDERYRELKKQLGGADPKAVDIGARLDDALNDINKGIAPYDARVAEVRGTAEQLGVADLELVETITTLSEKRAAVDDLLRFLVSGRGEPPIELSAREQLALEIARTVPAIAVELGQARKYPRTGALLLEAEHLRLTIEGLKKRLERATTRRDLLHRKRAAMIEEITWLGRARGALARIPASARARPLFDAYRSNADIRRDLADALLAYANAWTLGRLDQEEIRYRLIGLSHEGALDASANALAQWDNLIRVPLTQLVALHGSGITSDDISLIIGHIITAAGLGAVGVGVNQ
ncbi:hypothetical protein [Haliangium sp.]|uniref:hypothetical protein n=1 Tax=Haliangium sp. TaxID=2663208 RepID=UPI003D140D6F